MPEGNSYGLIHFIAPDYAEGVTLSMEIRPYHDDDRWLYLPADNVIRRIVAQDEYSSFMGTIFILAVLRYMITIDSFTFV